MKHKRKRMDDHEPEPDLGPVHEDGPQDTPEQDAADQDSGALGEVLEDEPRGRRFGGCIPVLLVLLVLVAGAVFGGRWAWDEISARFGDAPDYPGPGTGEVLYEVASGASAAQIGRDLKSAGVVKSVDAFTEAAAAEPRSRGIQVGFYALKEQMKAADALAVLVDPANMVQSTVTIPEGLRVPDTLKLLADKTDIPLRDFKRAVQQGEKIGLPDYAKGNAEGYLFPATYSVPPRATATTVLSSMVKRWRQAADAAGLEERAEELGYTPGELMIVASLVESEANRDQDRGKVARVIYNRLETDVTNGLLQIDATVNYALGRDLGLGLTTEDLQVDSPYNTRRFPGLPPGPIESPGDAAIEAAANPPEGDWVYYVTVNLDTGETRFTEDYDQFLRWKRVDLANYCAGSDRC